ncbi:hypothetical protein CPLU01_06607 [Colletotrichum plurivorum]|uniref:Secreted protein n=1 Tax=Colletotrichum plurivorum TaxID=2175906 RepID=A0A8H6NFJ2_9PEZI|nr:hypothetical protein CPLU01_06607 [Colletotrichum plurivorum]
MLAMVMLCVWTVCQSYTWLRSPGIKATQLVNETPATRRLSFAAAAIASPPSARFGKTRDDMEGPEPEHKEKAWCTEYSPVYQESTGTITMGMK